MKSSISVVILFTSKLRRFLELKRRGGARKKFRRREKKRQYPNNL
jgi:hypothetical protein